MYFMHEIELVTSSAVDKSNNHNYGVLDFKHTFPRFYTDWAGV